MFLHVQQMAQVSAVILKDVSIGGKIIVAQVEKDFNILLTFKPLERWNQGGLQVGGLGFQNTHARGARQVMGHHIAADNQGVDILRQCRLSHTFKMVGVYMDVGRIKNAHVYLILKNLVLRTRSETVGFAQKAISSE